MLTGLFAAFGAGILFWSIVALFSPSDWTVSQGVMSLSFWALWVLGWALLTRRLWKKASLPV